MNEVLRQEKKFLLSLPQMVQMSGQMARLMARDPHDTGDGYCVRSLYFDSLDDRDYFEKQAGVELRRKIRLRTYGPDTPFALLEMKQKQGALQKKRSLRLEPEQAKRLTEGDYSVLLSSGNPFAAECYAVMQMHCYRPRCVVEYRRTAFAAKENRTRITFDHHLTATESCFDLFSPQLLQNSVLSHDLAVLEVKYNGFLLNYIKDLLQQCGTSETSVSKYCLSRALGGHFTY